jgi:hypothetical protein
MIMERTNSQIKPIKSSTNRVTPAPSGSELKSGDTAGKMIQLRIPIGTAARAQMPRILPREYCSAISEAAFPRAIVSIFSSCILRYPDVYGIKSCGYCAGGFPFRIQLFFAKTGRRAGWGDRSDVDGGCALDVYGMHRSHQVVGSQDELLED